MKSYRKLNSEEIIEKLRTKDITSKIPKLALYELEDMISRAFFYSYKTDENTYSYKLVTDIIFNEKTKLVSRFKDYLIFDDMSEFLRRLYVNNEANLRIKKLAKFYENYSRIFPNYLAIPESRYLYKNIRKKQKLIDKLNQIEEENKLNHINLIKKIEERNKKAKIRNLKNNDSNMNDSTGKNTIFNTDVKNSILKYEPENTNNSGLDLIKNKLNFDEDDENNSEIINENKLTNLNSKNNISSNNPNSANNKIHEIIKNNLNKYNNIHNNQNEVNEIKVSELKKYVSEHYSFRNNNAIRITGGFYFFRDIEKSYNYNNINDNNENILSSSINLENTFTNNGNNILFTNNNNNSKIDFENSFSFNEIIKQMENPIGHTEKEEKQINSNKNILHEFMRFQENKNQENLNSKNQINNKIRNNFVNFDTENNYNYLIKNFEKEKNKIKYFELKQNNQTNYLNNDNEILKSNKKIENVFSNLLTNFNKIKKGFNYKKLLYHSFIQTENEKILKDDLIIKRILCEKYYQNFFNFDFVGKEKQNIFINKNKLANNRLRRIFEYIKKMNEINSNSNSIKKTNVYYPNPKENFNAKNQTKLAKNEFDKNFINFNINKFFYENNIENTLNNFNQTVGILSSNNNVQGIPLNNSYHNNKKLINIKPDININNNNKLNKKNVSNKESTDIKSNSNINNNNNILNIPNIIIPPNSYVNINNNFYNLYIKQEANSNTNNTGIKLNDIFEKKFTPKNKDKNTIEFGLKNLDTYNKPLSNRIDRIKNIILNNELNKKEINNKYSTKYSQTKNHDNPNYNKNDLVFNNSKQNVFGIKNIIAKEGININYRENQSNQNNMNNNRENNCCFSTPRKKDNQENNIYDKVLRILQDSSKPKNKNFINYEVLKNKPSAKKETIDRIKNFYNNEAYNMNNITENSKIKNMLNSQNKEDSSNAKSSNSNNKPFYFNNNLNSINNSSNNKYKTQNLINNYNNNYKQNNFSNNLNDYSTKFQTKISSQRNEVKSYDFNNIINHEIKKLSDNVAPTVKNTPSTNIFGSSSPTYRNSNEFNLFNKISGNNKKSNLDNLLNSSKNKRNYNHILDSYEDFNLDMNFTNSINANLYLNTEKSLRDFSEKINFKNLQIQSKTIENERDISSSRVNTIN